jgi:hypothetical protein
MKTIRLTIALLFSLAFWIFIGWLLLGCTTTKKINWNNHPYDPTQKIDLTLVPDIIPPE